MKKKVIAIVVVLLMLVAVSTSFYFFHKKSIETDKNKSYKDSSLENAEEIVRTGLFGEYYKASDNIMNKMSLEEKVGQLFLVRYDAVLVDDYIKNYYAGGFVLFAKDFQNHTKDSIKKELANHSSISKYSLTYAVDEEGGYVTRVSRFPNFRESKFLSPKEYYEQGGYDLFESTEREKAKLLLEIGLTLNLAPVADISTNKDDFIYVRSFGQDALSTSDFIKHMVRFSNSEGISSCLKHFPGYGNNLDTHTGVAIDTREYSAFTSNDYLPFIGGIEEKVPCILVSHNVIQSIDPKYPSSLSKKVITGELRDKLNFTGIVITDDLDMDAVKSYALNGNAATLAINAGADMIITSDFVNMYKEIINGVKSREISEETINDSVKRILAWKMLYGLFTQ